MMIRAHHNEFQGAKLAKRVRFVSKLNMSDENSQKLSIKIVSADYYLTKPIAVLNDPCYSGFKSSPIYNVPIIRIFGPTSGGVKTCLHIHGVFPYLFIPNWNDEITEKDEYQFAANLDKAINTSFAYSSSKTSHVHRISKVSGRPFYGYYEEEKPFLKIEFYNPAIMKRASDLLQNGIVTGQPFQPYEAHIPFILQFFIDNNLYGMNFIVLRSYKTRIIADEEASENIETRGCVKQSYCALEIDASISDIINPLKNSENMPNNPGLAFIWEEEKKRRKVQRRNSEITFNASQNRPEKPLTRTELYFETKLAEKLHPLKHQHNFIKTKDVFFVEKNSVTSMSQGSEGNSSFEELNTQGRSILSLLEHLVHPEDVNKKSSVHSPPSSPSIVYSDDDVENDFSNVSLLRSQPVLQLHAEDDSILGNRFSDEEVDDYDHFTLSQSLAYGGEVKLFSSSDSDSENFANIPQLDGATVLSPKTSRSRRKKETKSVNEKKEIRTKRSYNLRSRHKNTDTISEAESSLQNDSKISPKKQYPQLQIDTQRSPKMMAARKSKIASTNQVIHSEITETVNLRESSANIIDIENPILEDGRRSESKRQYPQLEVNVTRSPNMNTKNETDSFSNISKRLIKRKIDFDDSEVSSNNSKMFDVSSITAKWKKRRLNTRTNTNNRDSMTEEISDCYRTHHEVHKIMKRFVVDPFEDIFGNDDGQENNACTVSSDTNSQKFSLKINLNSVGLDTKLLYDDIKFRVPVIRLTRISEENLKIKNYPVVEENDDVCFMGIEKKCLKNFKNPQIAYARTEESLEKCKNYKKDGGDLRNTGIGVNSCNGTRRRKNIGRTIGKCKMINIRKNIRDELQSENHHHVGDISNELAETVARECNNDDLQTIECQINSISNKNSLKKRNLGIRMGVKNKSSNYSSSQSSIPFNVPVASIRSETDVIKIDDDAFISSEDVKKESSAFHESDVCISDPRIKDEQFFEKNSADNLEIEKTMEYSNCDYDFKIESNDLESQTSNLEILLKNEDENICTLKMLDLVEGSDCCEKYELSSCEISSKASSGIPNTVICSSDYDPELDLRIAKEYECDTNNFSDLNSASRKSNLLHSIFELSSTADETETKQSNVPDEFTIVCTAEEHVCEFRNQKITSKLNDTLKIDLITCTNATETESQNLAEKSNEVANMDTIICSNSFTSQSQDILELKNDPANMDTILCSEFVECRNQNKLKDSSRSSITQFDSNFEPTQLCTQIGSAESTASSNLNSEKVTEKCIPNATEMETIICSGSSEEDKPVEICSLDKNLTENKEVMVSDENYLTKRVKDSNGDDRSNISQSDLSADSIICSMDSVDDLIFSEINLPPYIASANDSVQKPGRCGNSQSEKSRVLDVGEINLDEPKILKQTRITKSEESDGFGKNVIPHAITCDDSAWDSLEGDDCENEIRSFYIDESLMAANTTLFQNDKSSSKDDKSPSMLKSTPESNKIPEIAENDDRSSPILKLSVNSRESTNNEGSSPIFSASTAKGKTDEILSFYANKSPTGSVVSIDDKFSDTESDTSSQNKTNSSENQNSSPSTVLGSQSPVMLHSTPQQGKSKKSPSPTYTPILKKLMLKKLGSGERNVRRRISSQRFQLEPFLENIREEEEAKFDDKNNRSMSLPLNVSEEKLSTEDSRKTHDSSRSSSCGAGSGQIDVTLANTYGFRMGLENLQDVKTDVQYQYITIMSMELFAVTRSSLRPDPEYDSICCLFYSIFSDVPGNSALTSGIVIVDADSSKLDIQRFNCEKVFVSNEIELFDRFVSIFRKYDPDILLGYEIEMLSWGYFIQRGQFLNRNCDEELSRVKESRIKDQKHKSIVEDSDYSNDMKLVGRIVLNVWRLMRHEIALQSYTFENIIFHVLHQRVPQHSFQSLTEWYKNPLRRWLVIDYYLFRVENNILLLQQLDFFGRTSELAKLFGILFYEVLSRGSQFRVESMMLRLVKTKNFVAVSPNPKQRAAMRAPESLPLIMEPESKFYTDPVIVLDFQSLYPSIIIAYNYCFSTCLGRVEHFVNNETFEFGCVHHTVPAKLLLKLESSLNFSPCGVAFVNKNIRTGILPAMLEEILETRLMVKKSMKENKANSILQRVLHARQLGLKLIANVTYGYTSANFSGRMPCIEVGDSVVSKGRETLERAIELISKTKKWSARVVYGDTDSIFVLTPNRTKEEAFQIGNEIVEAVTNDNPKPVKLKLEKVYYPCILQTKKRYVGYMYESADQKEPVYDAKGIETVRRDGCPAISKMLEKSLKLLFENKNVDVVKRYVQRQFTKLMSGRLSLQELTFAREYRGMSNYRPAACVPALQIAKQALLKDRRSEPRVKERVRYVLVAGPPGVPLIRLVRTPEQFFVNPGSIVNVDYYITRAIIPALERCFSLMNVNVQTWYTELPRRKQIYFPVENDLRNKVYKKKTISHYFTTSKCVVCDEIALSSVCQKCQEKPQQLAISLADMINSWQRKYNYISKICGSCCGRMDKIDCISLDCPIFYIYYRSKKDAEQVPYIEELQQKYLHIERRKSGVNVRANR